MFVPLRNTPRDYAWGSKTAIADLLGAPASGHPEAEYWLGTHPGSPSLLADPRAFRGATRLSELTTLPFLLKVLAADAPLSLQAHPTVAQARAGFERENEQGIALGASNRNYKDAMHKPELIYALSAEFVALCGFRPVAETRELLLKLGADPAVTDLLARLTVDGELRSVFEWLISRSAGVETLVSRIVDLARARPEPEFEMIGELAQAYPGDPGIAIALLLNRVVLHPGQVLYLPAGNIHAYLRGVGIELMAASDNVLRGGLTPKHIDVDELLAVLDFDPSAVSYLEPDRPSPGVEEFRPDVPDFELAVVAPKTERARFSPAAESILLCLDGQCRVSGVTSSVLLDRGDSVYVTADEGELQFEGSGTVFVATTNRQQK
ncbi:MAG: mannose-6-phosphate isomerase [Actinomycetota bacterium]|jgi:mannose-6-phosphate isomerase|nr:mannose-6-phosphate isomerase [Actinomycetota bacterium]